MLPASVLESGLECLGLNQLQLPRTEEAWPRSEVSAPREVGGSKQPPEMLPSIVMLAERRRCVGSRCAPL